MYNKKTTPVWFCTACKADVSTPNIYETSPHKKTEFVYDPVFYFLSTYLSKIFPGYNINTDDTTSIVQSLNDSFKVNFECKRFSHLKKIKIYFHDTFEFNTLNNQLIQYTKPCGPIILKSSKIYKEKFSINNEYYRTI